jgi:membrane protease YdiL (CAAX protease family)
MGLRTWVRTGTAPLAHHVRPAPPGADGSVLASRRAGRIALAVVAGGAATAKSVLIAGGDWSTGAQVALLTTAVAIAFVVLAHGPDDEGVVGFRPGRAGRALGLLPLPPDPEVHPGSPGRWGLAVAAGAGVLVVLLEPPLPLTVAAGLVAVGSAAGLVRLEARRPESGRPGREALLSVGPFLVTGVVAGAILAGRAEPGHLTGGVVVDLLVLIALAEELIYRSAVLALAHRSLSPLPAEIVTAVAFGLSHLGNESGALGVPLPVLGGLLFSLLRHRTRSLAGAVGGHAANNLPFRVLSG